MINQEFKWEKISPYLCNSVNTVIVGPSTDDRSTFFPSFWAGRDCRVIKLYPEQSYQIVHVQLIENNELIFDNIMELLVGLKPFLISIINSTEVLCIDLSSLHHSILMYICMLIVNEIKPRQFFATYCEPKEYLNMSQLGEYNLSDEGGSVQPVLGFGLRTNDRPIHLLSFLGFEGNRLIRIVEDTDHVKSIVPIIGFPSFRPGWQAKALQNCMDAIEFVQAYNDIHKCNAASIFDAYNMIHSLRKQHMLNALAPLGTRPHTVACALYASKHEDTQIIYDFPVEVTPRSRGILTCLGYNLTPFINR